MTEPASPIPPLSPAGPPARHPARIPILIGAALLGGGIIGLACHSPRPDPPVEGAAPGISVGSNSVRLTPDAPQWSVIKVAAVQAAEPHWSDPVPGRIVFDEAHASRLGSPLAGRVTAVTVERGQRVKAGAAPLTTPSPPRAAPGFRSEKAPAAALTSQVPPA